MSLINPVVFEEIAEAAERKRTPEYRVFPIEQARLLDDGSEIPKKAEKKKTKGALIKTTKYTGNRWGGKYLRAPDIFSAIWEHPLMRPMTTWAQARLGVTTGANDFFFIRKVGVNKYLAKFDDRELQITLPKEFTTTVLRTSSECNNTSFYGSGSPYRLFLVAPNCRDPLVVEYIRWGEELGVHKRPFFKGKKCWYALGDVPRDRIAVSEIVYSRYYFVWNAESSVLNKNFYGYVLKGIDHELLWAMLNFSLTFLYFELSSRKPGAGASGIGVRVANALKILDVNAIDKDTKRNLRSAGQKLLDQPIQNIWDTVLQPERQALDALIFNVLGLPPSNREELYDGLVDLVKARMEKAQSVRQS